MTDVPRPRPGRTFATALAPLALAAALAAAPTPPAARAQAIVPAANPEADRLAELVRRIGASPRDLAALVEAGELSFKLGDATAAAALYKRAEAIDPRNARVKGGIARILVNGERPGEALRYFDEAQRYGAVMARYADDRGLAYDLIGEQERAQRDYRLALAQGGATGDELDEVRRRYALSLGISGRQQEALAEIDTLLRRSDRGAWRARAFILAMGGDVPGANRIATGMMPPGMAQGLAAFFQRLPTLNAADRAFAVHFGEVTPTAARLADARMVPVLPVLGADPYAPRRVEVAAVTPTPVAEKPLARGEQRRRLKEAERQRQLAARGAAADRQLAARPVSPPTPTPAAAPQVAAAVPPPTSAAASISPTQLASAPPVSVARPPAAAAPASVARAPVTAASATPLSAAGAVPPATRPAAAAPSSAGAQAAGTQVAAATPTYARATPPSASPPSPSPAGARPVAAAPAPATVAARPTPPRLGEDSILARIVAGISVPGAELGVAPMPGTQRVVAVAAPPAPTGASLDEAAQAAERNAAADEQKRQRLAAAKRVTTRDVAADEPVEPARARGRQLAAADKRTPRTVAEEEAPVGRRGARGRVATDDEPAAKGTAAKSAARKAASDRKLATEKDGDEDDAPTGKGGKNGRSGKGGNTGSAKVAVKAEREEPARIWVQVAGGANPGDLGKAWKSAQGKAPALAGKRAYTTPLRATHRVVTGPFKTQAEARAMVNTLAKQGLSAFTFTSEAGQKVSRLDDQ
ncbi:SPOR domain-containing protein [Sphingomonas sp. BK580]|uniref:SPOR domain-containing protein n=1 Tax=Sphingomonas sp. BK580 TaxID=2586972 RepID=UPI0016074C8B|nr:SPOR domain-containing protein [Sphingomonas sp. BK580]MBB3695425.1 tetratricopeptide (TPR) repeat protein [Sphingomonas sp. BK580]